MAADASLLSTSPQGALEHCILPQLAAEDLARLSCTCSHMRLVLATIDAGTWRVAAAAILSSSHPSLSAPSNAAVRNSLRIYVASR